MPVDPSPVDDDLTIRRFEPGDGERVRELAESAMADTPEYVPDAPDADLRDVEGHYLDRGGEFLVGLADGDLVGTGAYEPLEGWMAEQFDSPADATAELSRMRVAADHRGRGVGTAIHRALADRARADGYRRFVLNTGVENDRARGFYEARGFEHVRDATVTFDGVTLDLALYRRRLG